MKWTVALVLAGLAAQTGQAMAQGPTMCSRAWMLQKCANAGNTKCERSSSCRTGCVEHYMQQTGCSARPERFADRIKACCTVCNKQYCRQQ